MDDVVEQGLGFDLATLGRRRMLRALGLGVVAVGAAACGAPSTAASAAASAGEIPDETAGPYPGDGSNGPNVLAESGIVRSDIRSSFGSASGTAEGVPMTLELATVTGDVTNGYSVALPVAVDTTTTPSAGGGSGGGGAPPSR